MKRKTNPIKLEEPIELPCEEPEEAEKKTAKKTAEKKADPRGISFLKPEKLRVRLTFIEDVLGSMPGSQDILADYIASRSPDADTLEDEIAAIGEDAARDKRKTIFPRDEEGNPFIYDYQIKGYLKEAARIMKKSPGSIASGIKSFVKEIDGLVFPAPRKITYHIPAGKKMGECTRPLRANTPLGERVSIACSETIPAGSWIEFEIVCFTGDMYDLCIELLDYGEFKGIGQWRNSGTGRFTWDMI